MELNSEGPVAPSAWLGREIETGATRLLTKSVKIRKWRTWYVLGLFEVRSALIRGTPTG